MPLPLDDVTGLVEKARQPENNRKRRFTQSIQLSVKVMGVDVSRGGLRINEVVELPHPRPGREPSVCVISGGPLVPEARRLNLPVVSRESLEALAGNKKEARKVAKGHDFFVAEAPLMPLVGKVLGPFLGPKDKMPTPVPPTASLAPMAERLRRSVRLRLRGQPIVSCVVGDESMTTGDVAENIQRVLTALEGRLPAAEKSIDYVAVKTSMGKPVKLRLRRR